MKSVAAEAVEAQAHHGAAGEKRLEAAARHGGGIGGGECEHFGARVQLVDDPGTSLRGLAARCGTHGRAHVAAHEAPVQVGALGELAAQLDGEARQATPRIHATAAARPW